DHNYRHKNALADKLANLAMDRKAEVTEVDGGGGAGVREGAGGEAPARGASALDAPAAVGTEAGDRFGCGRCGCVLRVEAPSSLRPHQLKPFACQCGS